MVLNTHYDKKYFHISCWINEFCLKFTPDNTGKLLWWVRIMASGNTGLTDKRHRHISYRHLGVWDRHLCLLHNWHRHAYHRHANRHACHWCMCHLHVYHRQACHRHVHHRQACHRHARYRRVSRPSTDPGLCERMKWDTIGVWFSHAVSIFISYQLQLRKMFTCFIDMNWYLDT